MPVWRAIGVPDVVRARSGLSRAHKEIDPDACIGQLRSRCRRSA
ncbi:hypothetical protein ACTMU2_39415 [Cupriavidus basilensis]